MKYLLLILLFSSSLFSQILPGGKSERYEEKRSSSKNEDRAFFGLGIGILNINTYTGAEGSIFFGVIKNSNLIIGGGINAVLFDSFKVGDLNTSFVRYTNGFANIGYYLKLNDYLKLSPKLAAGIGRLNTSTNRLGIIADNNGDWYYFLEPNLAIDIKIYRKSHLDLELSYRNAFDVEEYGLSNSDVSSLVYKINFKMIIE